MAQSTLEPRPPPPHPGGMERGDAARRYGRLCEAGTALLLWLRGWDIAGRNLKAGRFEIDLLAARGRELRLVEVKARAEGAWTGAETALSPAQRLRLQMALRAWLARVPWPFAITFQRVSWSGWRCRFHPPERWEGFR